MNEKKKPMTAEEVVAMFEETDQPMTDLELEMLATWVNSDEAEVNFQRGEN